MRNRRAAPPVMTRRIPKTDCTARARGTTVIESKDGGSVAGRRAADDIMTKDMVVVAAATAAAVDDCIFRGGPRKGGRLRGRTYKVSRSFPKG